MALQEAHQQPSGGPGQELGGDWGCLTDLLCGGDSWGVRLGQQWLYNLLVTTAETNLVHSHLPAHAGLALLPCSSQQVCSPNQDKVDVCRLLPWPHAEGIAATLPA